MLDSQQTLADFTIIVFFRSILHIGDSSATAEYMRTDALFIIGWSIEAFVCLHVIPTLYDV